MEGKIIEQILIVDDEEAYRSTVGQFLQREGYSCALAADAGEALEVLGRNHFDLVISDIKMNGKDGLQLAREAIGKYPRLCFVIMTAHASQYTYNDIIDAGASDFITKPFSIGELRAKIERIEKERQLLHALCAANEALHATLDDTIDALASSLEMRDPYTAGHQHRVTALACAITEEMGMPVSARNSIRMAGRIHDIGKISVPSEILSKPSKLKDNEMSLIQDHCMVGFDILSKVRFESPIAEIVQQHHERMNGTGYPNKLSGQDILPEARIIAVADVVEAMSSHRPYRPALGIKAALHEITENKGVLYDPGVTEACLSLFNRRGFNFE